MHIYVYMESRLCDKIAAISGLRLQNTPGKILSGHQAGTQQINDCLSHVLTWKLSIC